MYSKFTAWEAKGGGGGEMGTIKQQKIPKRLNFVIAIFLVRKY